MTADTPPVPAQTSEGAAITDLILAVFLANGRLMRAGDALLRDLGLTGARWQILCGVVDTPRTVAQIARRYELSRQGVLWVVQGLAKDAIVELVNNPDHKRAKLVRLTDKGRSLLIDVERRQRPWSNDIAATFRLDEIHQAIAYLERLGKAVANPAGDLE